MREPEDPDERALGELVLEYLDEHPQAMETLDGIAEVFNMFNHANYNAFVTNEVAANYRQPQYDSNIAFQPRTAQFGFRTTF